MAQSSNVPTTLASRELPSAMLFDLPCKPAPSDMTSMEKASVRSNIAVGGSKSTFWDRHNATDVRRGIPDRSKHNVSPSALSAALQKFTDASPSDNDDTGRGTVFEETLRKHKRARIDKTTARLEGRSLFPEAGPSSASRIKEDKHAPIKVDEESYWEGALGQSETQTAKVATEGTSQSARRLLFEYGRRNARPVPVMQLDSRTAEASASNTLPHRPCNPEAHPDASNVVDNTSEDEGFAIVHRAQAARSSTPHTQMSSPELVPAVSIAQTVADDKVSSDDEWTML